MQYARIDKTLAFCVLCLVVLGTLFVYSSSYYRAMKRGEDSTYYLFGHLKRLGIASVFFLLGFIIPYQIVRKLLFPLLLMMILTLILTLVVGRPQFGARRSLALSSFGLQVSEFARIWIIFFLAHFFATHPQTANTGKGMLTIVVLCLFIILLIAVQPSFSMAIICAVVVICMFVYGRVPVRMLMPTVAISIAMFALFALVFPHTQDRLTGFIAHPTYQVQQSLIAIGSGGLIGKGPGAGLQKFLFLPRIHNDFIFAHIAEEFGFIGSVILFGLFWQVYLRGLAIAGAFDDEFSRLLVLGLNVSIFTIFLIHVGVSVGLLPPTGVPLPFISFGGWSLAANLFAIGVILQASKKRIL